VEQTEIASSTVVGGALTNGMLWYSLYCCFNTMNVERLIPEKGAALITFSVATQFMMKTVKEWTLERLVLDRTYCQGSTPSTS
jgi:hypothetical protein